METRYFGKHPHLSFRTRLNGDLNPVTRLKDTKEGGENNLRQDSEQSFTRFTPLTTV